MGGNDTFMTIVIDIDGVIAVPRKDNLHWNCSEVVEAASSTRSLREKGNKLIFWTSRPEEDRQITVDWLYVMGFGYDELHMAKPKGDFYIDDKALRFESWDKLRGILGF
jgi:uncharacterized HAD superfamily protein